MKCQSPLKLDQCKIMRDILAVNELLIYVMTKTVCRIVESFEDQDLVQMNHHLDRFNSVYFYAYSF